MPHLLAALSPHGYGHAAMTAPILNHIKSHSPDINVTLYTSLPKAWLRSRLNFDFELIDGIQDFGLIMHSATEIDLDASAQGYIALHEGWEAKAQAEAERLGQVQPTLILANVPHLVLAGAQLAKIPALAMSSLNWADIYQAYLGQRPEAPRILGQMRQAYAGAEQFLKLSPGLPMMDLPHARHLGPSARRGRNLRSQLCRAVDILEEQCIGLIAYGGIPTRLPVEDWPAIPGWLFFVPPEWNVRHPGFVSWEQSGMDFLDLIASVDILITKPGYGTYTEAACNGTAVLAQERPDWPETPYFESWMRRHARFATLSQRSIQAGQLHETLQSLMAMPRPPPPEPSGIGEASEIILEMLNNLR
jgi:hypothetical protein